MTEKARDMKMLKVTSKDEAKNEPSPDPSSTRRVHTVLNGKWVYYISAMPNYTYDICNDFGYLDKSVN